MRITKEKEKITEAVKENKPKEKEKLSYEEVRTRELAMFGIDELYFSYTHAGEIYYIVYYMDKTVVDSWTQPEHYDKYKEILKYARKHMVN